MTFDIKVHILDHAHLTVGDLPKISKKIVHFNTSVDTTYFIRQGIYLQEKIDKTMSQILQNLYKKTIEVKEKNGTYTRKNGTKKQKYRTRIIRFDSILSAYHSRHFDGSKSVNPHFHFLFSSASRMGKDFIYLKQALSEEASSYGIKFNFMEPRQTIGLSKKQLNRIESFSWLLHQGNFQKIEAYFSNKTKLVNTLDLLHKYYKDTQNISYYMKVLQILNQRMQELDLNFDYRSMNLRNSIYFFLSSRDKEIMADLSHGKEVRLDMDRVLDREIIKFAYGFGSDAVSSLNAKFQIESIEKSQLYFPAPNKIDTSKPKTKNDFRNRIVGDIRNTLAFSTSEKHWKDALVSMGYQKVSTKSRKLSSGKREKIGLSLVTAKGSRVYISFLDASLCFSQITNVLMNNSRKQKKSKNIESALSDYQEKKKKRDREYAEYIYRVRILLKIYTNSISATSPYKRSSLENLAESYEIQRSDLYDITTFSSSTTTIVDTTKAITLKKSTSKDNKKIISDMLDIAVMKGWDLETLIVEGDEAFVRETKRQIAGRLESHKNPEKRRDNVGKYSMKI